jgi:hypothetical protein
LAEGKPIQVSYHCFKIRKQSGGYRTISAPNPELKEVQNTIYKALMRLGIGAGPLLHAYVRHRSIKTMAQSLQIRDDEGTPRTPHYMLKIDIKDFFPSLTKKVVMEACKKARVPAYYWNLVGSYCFQYDEKRGEWILPQGSPASPFLSNLVMRQAAARINGVVKSWNRSKHFLTKFAAYCDNLAFTADDPAIVALIYPTERILKTYGLVLNKEKIRFLKAPARKEVCGVVMSDHTAPRKEYWRMLRAQLFNALVDVRAGHAPPGFCLTPEARKKIREDAGILGKEGYKRKITNGEGDRIPIPWGEWKGRISFVTMLHPEKGKQLAMMLADLEKETEKCRNRKLSLESASVSTSGSPTEK